MKTATITPLFPMLQSAINPQEEKERAITSAWTLAHAALWPNENFNEREILHFKFLIGELFEESVSAEKNLIRFCVRVMLAKRLNEAKRFYYVLRPHLWLNKNYQFGYSTTQSYYDELIQKRTKVAGYDQALFVLAYGVYKYAQNPCTQIYSLYRGKLSHLRQWTFLSVFNNTVLFQNHLNK